MEIHGANGSKDERGLVSHEVPYLATKFEQVLTVGAGSYGGLPETGRTWRMDQAGCYVVYVTYEGQDPNTSTTAKEAETFEAKSSYREEPIEGHPQIEELIKKFNGTRDSQTQKVTFQAMMQGTGTNALGADSNQKEIPNPMAGVEKFMALEVVWTRQYIKKTIPASIFARIGRITSNPPGGAPKIPGRSAWLIMPPQVKKRGNVVEISEEYTLLPENTPKELYDLGKLAP
jgi:hypothetical protein